MHDARPPIRVLLPAAACLAVAAVVIMCAGCSQYGEGGSVPREPEGASGGGKPKPQPVTGGSTDPK
jgi:hypothetical protein